MPACLQRRQRPTSASACLGIALVRYKIATGPRHACASLRAPLYQIRMLVRCASAATAANKGGFHC